jgi:hypothetical protein
VSWARCSYAVGGRGSLAGHLAGVWSAVPPRDLSISDGWLVARTPVGMSSSRDGKSGDQRRGSLDGAERGRSMDHRDPRRVRGRSFPIRRPSGLGRPRTRFARPPTLPTRLRPLASARSAGPRRRENAGGDSSTSSGARLSILLIVPVGACSLSDGVTVESLSVASSSPPTRWSTLRCCDQH